MSDIERIHKTRESVRLHCARLCDTMAATRRHPSRPLCSEHKNKFDEQCVECVEIELTLKRVSKILR